MEVPGWRKPALADFPALARGYRDGPPRPARAPGGASPRAPRQKPRISAGFRASPRPGVDQAAGLRGSIATSAGASAPNALTASPPLSKHPLNSLATKLILFVFVSTLATALAVSWISIQSTHDYLSQQIRRQYPASLTHAGEALLGYLVAGQEELAGLTGESLACRAGLARPQVPIERIVSWRG